MMQLSKKIKEISEQNIEQFTQQQQNFIQQSKLAKEQGTIPKPKFHLLGINQYMQPPTIR